MGKKKKSQNAQHWNEIFHFGSNKMFYSIQKNFSHISTVENSNFFQFLVDLKWFFLPIPVRNPKESIIYTALETTVSLSLVDVWLLLYADIFCNSKIRNSLICFLVVSENCCFWTWGSTYFQHFHFTSENNTHQKNGAWCRSLNSCSVIAKSTLMYCTSLSFLKDNCSIVWSKCILILPVGR